MAYPTITVQPGNYSFNSTINPIIIRATEYTSNTLNLVAQVQVWNTVGMTPPSQWVDYGGKMRCASDLDFPGNFFLNIEDIVNPLTDAWLQSQHGLDNCYAYGGTSWLEFTFTDWEYEGNRLVRVRLQREYLDADGIIQIDPDITTTNRLVIHEGSPPNNMNFRPGVTSWQPYRIAYDSTNQTGKKLYFTNYPRTGFNPRPNVSHNVASSQYIYDFSMKEWEDFPICFYSNPFFTGQTNNVGLETFDAAGVSLNTRLFNYACDADGMQSFMIGPKSLRLYNTPNGAEGTNFENVAQYYITQGSQISSGSVTFSNMATPINVKIDRTCEGAGYKRFAWRNQLGGWDMFSSDGEYREQNSITRDTFQRRIAPYGRKLGAPGYATTWAYGKNNWNNKTIKQGRITSHAMTNVQAKWFSEIGSSQMVYVQMFNKRYNPVPNYTDFDVYEDDWTCQWWTPIIITSKSIKNINTKDRLVKVSFTFEYAVNERFGRM